MKIENIPYIEDKNQDYASCQGPPTVMMAFKFFFPDEPITFPRLYKLLGYTHGTWFFEMYIASLFHKKGVPIIYYSDMELQKIGNSAEKFQSVCGMDFGDIKNRDEIDIEHYDQSVEYVLSNNLFQKKEIKIKFIKSLIKQNKVVIATVNRNTLMKKQ